MNAQRRQQKNGRREEKEQSGANYDYRLHRRDLPTSFKNYAAMKLLCKGQTRGEFREVRLHQLSQLPFFGAFGLTSASISATSRPMAFLRFRTMPWP
jgi:hypothetical protein